MLNYGYPWPTIVGCEQFPVDNDMCIMAQSSKPATPPKPAAPPKPRLHNKERKNGKGNRRKQNKQREDEERARNEAQYGGAPGGGHGNSGRVFGRQSVAIYEPQPQHLHHSRQHLNEQRFRTEARDEEAAVPDEEEAKPEAETGGKRSGKRGNKHLGQLYTDIVTKFCESQWSECKDFFYPKVPRITRT